MNNASRQPLVLDLDNSLPGLDGVGRIALGQWQEAVRFGCSLAVWARFRQALANCLPPKHGPVLLGSGDFHHLSHLLLERLATTAPVDVVVFDNHPDNMRFPFGIHCGSWVRHAAALPGVGTLHVVGIASPDVGWRHAWENYLLPLYRGKVRYWTLGAAIGWTRPLGAARACRNFATREALIAAVTAELGDSKGPVYLSIDKDVLSPEVARTNWDQGHLQLADLEAVIASLAGRLAGSDITGEVSVHRYATRWKRWLSTLDDQPAIDAGVLTAWQAEHVAVDRRLLAAIADAG